MGNSDFTQTRQPAVAGQFYPGGKDRLAAVIKECLAAAGGPPAAGRVRALVVPHAGYIYSGATAGRAYALLTPAANYARAVILSPSHRAVFRGLSLGNYAALTTPLGDVPVDVAACRCLVGAHPLIGTRLGAHTQEHALEVQLPFLQTVLPGLPVVPIVCGDLTPEELRGVATVLRTALWDPATLWIVSSDFTHFGEGFDYVPFAHDVPRRLAELDRGAIGRITDFDTAGFVEYVDRTGATICGRTPIALLLAVAEPARSGLRAQLLHYTTSGELTHDWEQSVSYAAIAIMDATSAAAAAAGAAPAAAYALDAADKAQLLALARQAIATGLARQRLPTPAAESLSAVLAAPGAAFVSLHLDGDLRGCIGSIEAEAPLYRDVLRNARSAAFEDPRFLPLSAAEFARVTIEISVLTPPRRIASPEEFEVGRHGIILEKGRRGAVFLPQVAPEEGWDRETTLNHLAAKAGLERSAWRRDATFRVFEAIVFSEKPA